MNGDRRKGGISFTPGALIAIVLVLGLLVAGFTLSEDTAGGIKGVMEGALDLAGVAGKNPDISDGNTGNDDEGGDGDGGSASDAPLERPWVLRVVEAHVWNNLHSDTTTASDPIARVTVDGESKTTSRCTDCVPGQNGQPVWDEPIFRKPGKKLTSVHVQILDYDDSGNFPVVDVVANHDNMGECDISVPESRFQDSGGITFEITKECDDFAVTLGFDPRNIPN